MSETIELFSSVPFENWILGLIALLIMGVIWGGKLAVVALLARWVTRGFRR